MSPTLRESFALFALTKPFGVGFISLVIYYFVLIVLLARYNLNIKVYLPRVP